MKPGTGEKVFFAAAVMVVITAVVVALFLLGSPAKQRMKKFDSRRVSDLQLIKRSIDFYWRRHQTLPVDLDALAKERWQITKTDPVTSKPYGYRVVDADTYDLCAEFATESTNRAGLWAHRRGQHCFTFDTDHGKR
jgi:hypothetical protein